MSYNLELWVVTRGHKQEIIDQGPIENEVNFIDIKNSHEYYPDKTLED
jgi:hypothetical protein